MTEQRPSTFDRSLHAPVPCGATSGDPGRGADLFLIAVIVAGFWLINSLINNLEASKIAIDLAC